MKRAALLFVGLAACAQAAGDGNTDAPIGPPADSPRADAPRIDAPGTIDAPHIDASIDAPMVIDAAIDAPIDAPKMIDAPIDAPRIDAAPDACVPVTSTIELLTNGTFDLAPLGSGWTQQPINSMYPIIRVEDSADAQYADSGTDEAWLGGYASSSSGTYDIDYLYQNVTVPAGTTSLVLTGKRDVNTYEDLSSPAYDSVRMGITTTSDSTGASMIETALSLSNINNDGDTPSWTAFSYSFSNLEAGSTIRLIVTSQNDFSLPTNFLFDSLSLKATYTHCP